MNTFWYTFKIWQTSVIVSAICIASYGGIINFKVGWWLSLIYFATITGTTFSFPSFILFWLATYFIVRINFTDAYKKLMVSVIGLLLTLLPFCLISLIRFNAGIFFLALPYVVTIVAGIYYFKLHIEDPEQ